MNGKSPSRYLAVAAMAVLALSSVARPASSATMAAPAVAASSAQCAGFGRYYGADGAAARDMSGAAWDQQLCAGMERTNWLATQN
jgi:hypothetical protein